ncbi:MAG: hypothetical protein EXS14_08365 [Planctomycetes bacterium]|nr:hypothetical protein [Planctomycetota bacterium]
MNDATPQSAAPTPPTPPIPPTVVAAVPQNATIGIEQFQCVDLRAGRVLSAAPHEKADRLLVLQVDIGESAPRQIVAGIRADWTPEALVGRTVIVLANLKPAMLRGVESQGMMLALRGPTKVIPIGVDGEVLPGTRVS